MTAVWRAGRAWLSDAWERGFGLMSYRVAVREFAVVVVLIGVVAAAVMFVVRSAPVGVVGYDSRLVGAVVAHLGSGARAGEPSWFGTRVDLRKYEQTGQIEVDGWLASPVTLASAEAAVANAVAGRSVAEVRDARVAEDARDLERRRQDEAARVVWLAVCLGFTRPFGSGWARVRSVKGSVPAVWFGIAGARALVCAVATWGIGATFAAASEGVRSSLGVVTLGPVGGVAWVASAVAASASLAGLVARSWWPDAKVWAYGVWVFVLGQPVFRMTARTAQHLVGEDALVWVPLLGASTVMERLAASDATALAPLVAAQIAPWVAVFVAATPWVREAHLLRGGEAV